MAKEKETNTEENSNSKFYKRAVRFLWLGSIFALLFGIAYFYMLTKQDLPTFEDLENPKYNLASEIYSANDKSLGRFYIENRVPAQYHELNPYLIDALIATEDERYLEHSGIDFKALLRVAFGVLTSNSSKGGGSTITQQLAKLLYDRPNLKGNYFKKVFILIDTKLKEWITAVKLEKSYTKEEIMTMYLNKFEFIYGAHGIKAAAETYFGKKQEALDKNEAAMLIGMLKNPSEYNPKKFPSNAKQRMIVVLNQMKKNGKLDEAEYEELKEIDLDMSKFNVTTHSDGLAPYFRIELSKHLKKMFDKDEFRKPDGSKYDIYRDGLKIHTTIDEKMQALAEKTMVEHMTTVQQTYDKRWKNRDPWTYTMERWSKDIRENSLKALIKNSDRYKSLQATHLNPALDQFREVFKQPIYASQIDILLNEEKKPGYIKKQLARKNIKPKESKFLMEVYENEEWQNFKNSWNEFQAIVDREFNEPVEMTVFAYTDSGEKTMTMSPLDSIKYHRRFLQTGILAIDPDNGDIKVWVGGINHKYFQFDHIQASRQVGSTFKPFIYSTAIALQGISPCFKVKDEPITIAPGEGNFGLLEPWSPRNSDGEFTYEKLSLYEGLRQSKNTVSVFLMKELGNAEVVRGLVHSMGIDSSLKRSDGEFRVPSQPSICLGSADLSVMEMTSAYSTFANNGVNNKPTFISHIEDKNGRVIYRAIREEQMALNPKANYVMVDLLRNAKGAQFAGVQSEVGGKTGTTNDFVDGWFMGVTPNLVVGTWVGGEDPWIRFLNLSEGQGSRMAKPFFAKFLRKLEESKDIDFDVNARFNVPTGDLGIVIDCELYEQYYQQDKPSNNGGNETFEEEFEEEEFEE